MKSTTQKTLICFLIIIFATTQQETTTTKQNININQVYSISLNKNQTKIYSVKIQNLQANQSLFIQAASPIYDPYQIPSIIVRSNDGFVRSCSQENNEYLGLCEIQNSDLKQNRVFDVIITCYEKCYLNLQASLDQQFQIGIGQKIQINSVKQVSNVEQFKIKVPQDLKFTDIILVANILNKDQINEGVRMYVNIGDQNSSLPSAQKYALSGTKVWGNGIGVFMNQQQVKAGDWIKVLLVIGQGVNIEFYSQISINNTQQILLNTAYDDFTSQDQTKTYILDLTSVDNNDSNSQSIATIQHTTIQLVFVIYSGSPKIRVGFDKNFTKFVSNHDIEGTLSYLITPQVRKKMGFNGTIFIQVSSFWVSDYYFSTFTVSDKFYKIANGIAQIANAEEGEIQNFLYEAYLVVSNTQDAKKLLQQQIQSFRVRISLISGNAEVGIRRCLSMEQNNNLDCIISNRSILQSDPEIKKSFDQINITVRKDYSAYELYFNYNASQCTLYKQFSNLTIYNCEFQIVVFSNSPPGSDVQLVYSLTMYQNRQQATLKEGYIYKDFLYETTYHYYQFQLPSLENIEEVAFSFTVLSGDAQMMGTTDKNFRYMEFKDQFQQQNIYTSFFNTLTFKKDRLAETFYLAIYAYEATDLSVSVIVKRTQSIKPSNDTSTKNDTSTNNKTEVSTLQLTEGLSQKYSLNQGSSVINFVFTSRQKGNVSVQLIQIQGDVQFHLQKQGSTSEIPCMNSASAGELKCTFEVQQNTKYMIHVKGSNQKDVQTFSVSYFYPQTCKKYPLNLPQFVFLSANQSQCSTFSINGKEKSIQILTSFSTLDLLATNVKFNVSFNDKHVIQFSGRSKQITADELKQFCKSDTMDNCNMKISLKGDLNFNVQFYFVVEQQGKQMAMFDGIVRKVVDQKMSQKKGKFFYYEVSSMKQSVKIFTTNRDKVGYYVGAKFVQQSNFIASPDSLYLPFKNLNAPGIQRTDNVYQTRLQPRKGTSVIQIYAEQFKKYCNSCVILISIYGLEQQSTQANIFELQVTQQQSFIYLGQQKTGFLSQDQIYTYDIYGNPNAQSILTIRDFQKQSDKQKSCFVASVLQIQTQKMQQVKAGYALIEKGTSTYKIFIQNQAESICTYQIAYSALAHSVTVFNPYMPTQLKLQNYQTQYYLYNHMEASSFQILNYVKSGDLRISANKISSQNTIQKLVNKNIDLYDYKSNPGDSFLEVVDGNNATFCTNCYYMIAVKGDPNVQSQMALAVGNQALGLTTYGILKQTLKKGEKQSYVFYSIVDFNVSLPLLFGQIKLTIKSPSGKTVFQNSISKSIQVFVPKPSTAQGQYVDYYDQNSKFTILIQALKNSSYYISTKRKSVSMRIYQGVPITIQIKDTEQTTIEFVNIKQQDNVTVLLQVTDQQIQYDDQFWMNVTGEVMKQGEVNPQKLQNPRATQSQNSYNYIFKSIKGTYFLTFKAQKKVKASILLSKQKLTHLLSSANNLFMQKGTYEIYTPGHNLMIAVDSCLSQVEVKASQKYSNIAQVDSSLIGDESKSSSILLQHANYGGHYIITAENVEGEYFVEVNPKKQTDNILYVISYYYYDREDVMPYKKVDVDPQITYQLTDDKIIFKLNPVRPITSSSKSKQFKIKPTYTLYLSNSSEVATMNSKCDASVGFRLTQSSSGNNKDIIRFPIDLKTIQNQVGDSAVYYVSAKVQVGFQAQNLNSNYPPSIDLAYTKFQMTRQTTKVQFKSQTTSKIKYFLLWIVIPVLVSGILFVLALKFCIKKYRQLYPDQLVEEDRQMGQSEGQMKDGANSQKHTDSLTGT